MGVENNTSLEAEKTETRIPTIDNNALKLLNSVIKDGTQSQLKELIVSIDSLGYGNDLIDYVIKNPNNSSAVLAVIGKTGHQFEKFLKSGSITQEQKNIIIENFISHIKSKNTIQKTDYDLIEKIILEKETGTDLKKFIDSLPNIYIYKIAEELDSEYPKYDEIVSILFTRKSKIYQELLVKYDNVDVIFQEYEKLGDLLYHEIRKFQETYNDLQIDQDLDFLLTNVSNGSELITLMTRTLKKYKDTIYALDSVIQGDFKGYLEKIEAGLEKLENIE